MSIINLSIFEKKWKSLWWKSTSSWFMICVGQLKQQINFSAKYFKVASAFYDGGCPCQVLGSICKSKITLSEYFIALTKILLNHWSQLRSKNDKVDATGLMRDLKACFKASSKQKIFLTFLNTRSFWHFSS